MNEVEFDEAFDKFLDSPLCEREVGHISDLLRATFLAGWKAALGSDIGKVMKIEEREGAIIRPGPDGAARRRGRWTRLLSLPRHRRQRQ